MPIAPAK